MDLLILLIIFLCVAVIVSIFRKSGNSNKSKITPTFKQPDDSSSKRNSNQFKSSDLPLPELDCVTYPKHKASSYLTTENERLFHAELLKAIPDSCVIHCQVSLMALVQPVEWKHNSKTWAKRMDFVITDENTKVLAVIELDDRSHNTEKRKIRDDYVNNVLDGHHKLVRFKAARSYDSVKIKTQLSFLSDPLSEPMA